jgi:hypothetical protein
MRKTGQGLGEVIAIPWLTMRTPVTSLARISTWVVLPSVQPHVNLLFLEVIHTHSNNKIEM